MHITGGGFTDNLPRVMPDGLGCQIRRAAWEVPALFQWLQEVRLHLAGCPIAIIAQFDHLCTRHEAFKFGLKRP